MAFVQLFYARTFSHPYMRTLITSAALLALSLTIPSNARAQAVINWAVPTGDSTPYDWYAPANWNPAVAPTSLDTAVFNGNNLPSQYFDVFIQGAPPAIPASPSLGVDASSLQVINAAELYFPTDAIENIPLSRGLTLHAPADNPTPALLIDHDALLLIVGDSITTPVLEPSIEHLHSLGLILVGDTGIGGELFANTTNVRTNALTFGAQPGSSGLGTFSSMRLNVDTNTIIGDAGAGDVDALGIIFNTGQLHLGQNGGTGKLVLNTNSQLNITNAPAPGAHALTVGPGSQLTLSNSALFNSADSHIQNNGGAILINQQATFDNINITNTNSGQFTFNDVTIQGQIGGGLITNNTAATFNLQNATLYDYSITNNSDGFINFTNSSLEGVVIDNALGATLGLENSTLNGNLNNFGSLQLHAMTLAAPPPGTLIPHTTSQINGAFNQFPTASLKFNLSPLGVDQLALNGPASLAGNLQLNTTPDFDLPYGQSLTLITAPATFNSSTFDTYTGIHLNPNKILAPIYHPDHLEVLAALPADFNMDGTVNIADLIVWAQNFGSTDSNFTQGDANQDGLINIADLIRWAQRFGTNISALSPVLTVTNAAVAVPEPASLTLLTFASLFAMRRKRRVD